MSVETQVFLYRDSRYCIDNVCRNPGLPVNNYYIDNVCRNPGLPVNNYYIDDVETMGLVIMY